MSYFWLAIVNTLLLPLYLCTFFVPRRSNLWIFGAWFGNRYADNSRYMFEFVDDCVPNVQAVWLSRKPEVIEQIRRSGRQAYPIQSWKGFWLSCRAGLTFVTSGIADVNRVGCCGAKKINFWHGTPLKKILKDDTIAQSTRQSAWFRFSKALWMKCFPFDDEIWDIVISPSKVTSARLSTAFQLPLSQVKVTGYPRGDTILQNPPEEVSKLEELKKTVGGRRFICYAPTFRREEENTADLFANFDVASVEEMLKRHDAVFLIKMHYCHRFFSAAGGESSEASRIHVLTEEEAPDINKLLPHVDVLLTDYSSVYFDFLLLEKPIIFTPFDLERYNKVDRGFYEDYDLATPGPKCKSWPEVFVTLDTILSGKDDFQEDRMLAQRKYNEFIDTENCARVLELTGELLNAA